MKKLLSILVILLYFLSFNSAYGTSLSIKGTIHNKTDHHFWYLDSTMSAETQTEEALSLVAFSPVFESHSSIKFTVEGDCGYDGDPACVKAGLGSITYGTTHYEKAKGAVMFSFEGAPAPEYVKAGCIAVMDNVSCRVTTKESTGSEKIKVHIHYIIEPSAY